MFMNGLLIEERFFSAIAKRTSTTPEWFVGFRRANERLDMLGIDAVVWVTQRETGKRVRVPIQIKRSWAGVARHYVQHPEHWTERIVLLVVHEAMSGDIMRERLYDALRHVQSHSYDFKKIFKQVRKINVSVRIKKRMRRVEKGRDLIKSILTE